MLTFYGQNEPKGRKTFRVGRLARVISSVVPENAGNIHTGVPYTPAVRRIQRFVVFEPLVRDLGRPSLRQQRDEHVVPFGGRDLVGMRIKGRFICKMYDPFTAARSRTARPIRHVCHE